MAHIPSGTVLTSIWLKNQGVSPKLAWWYVHSHWLARLGVEAYKRAGDEVSWLGAIRALQTQLKLAVHVGGITALQLLGQAHYLPVSGVDQVTLFASPEVKSPRWLLNEDVWKVRFKIFRIALFSKNSDTPTLVERPIEGVNLFLSSPERAILEILHLVPWAQPFDEALLLMEGLSQLRPQVVQALLEQCQSIKVKRLFLHLAERFQHPYLTALDMKKIELGHGKRMIGKGGNYDPKYQISVPKTVEE